MFRYLIAVLWLLLLKLEKLENLIFPSVTNLATF